MKKIKIVKIVNLGQFNFDFNFITKPKDDFILVSPANGTVKMGSFVEVRVIIEPIDLYDIKTDIELEIVSGPK
jgi:hypothetical protein